MSDLSIDTSSYPKPALPVSPFDIANKYGEVAQRAQNLQSGALTIQTQKLQNANIALTHFLSGINSLGPNASREDIIKKGQNLVDSGMVPQDMVDAMDARIPTDPKQMQAFHNELMTQGASHLEMIQGFLGLPDHTLDDGTSVKLIRTPQLPGQQPSVAASFNKQLPIGTPTVNNDPNSPDYQQPVMVGPSGPAGVTGSAPAASPLPVQPSPPTQPVAPAATITPPANPAFATPASQKDQSRVAQGNLVPTGAPPLFEPGKTSYVADQAIASARQGALKPILQALPFIKGLQTGPGTQTFNTAVSGLKAFGILPTDITNDPQVIRQEVAKKLAQYVQGNPLVGRSDAGQALAEAGSPDPKHQLSPALLKLVQDSIGLDRVNILKPNAFQNAITDPQGKRTVTPRTDFQNYLQHGSKFAGTIDERD